MPRQHAFSVAELKLVRADSKQFVRWELKNADFDLEFPIDLIYVNDGKVKLYSQPTLSDLQAIINGQKEVIEELRQNVRELEDNLAYANKTTDW